MAAFFPVLMYWVISQTVQHLNRVRGEGAPIIKGVFEVALS